jgi:hypothetical protein
VLHTRLGAMLSNRYSVRALWILAFYTLPVAIVWVYTWHNTRPKYHGMDWILVSLLTYPGCGWELLFADREFVPMPFGVLVGLALNTAAIYLLTWLCSSLVVRSSSSENSK